MLHRYFFTLSIVVTFCLAQLGAFAHDISHIQDSLTHGSQIHADIGDAPSDQNPVKSTNNTKASSASDSILIDATRPLPQASETHFCDNCVGFATVSVADLQTTFALYLHQHLSLSLYLFQKFSHHSAPRYQAARAPP